MDKENGNIKESIENLTTKVKEFQKELSGIKLEDLLSQVLNGTNDPTNDSTNNPGNEHSEENKPKISCNIETHAEGISDALKHFLPMLGLNVKKFEENKEDSTECVGGFVCVPPTNKSTIYTTAEIDPVTVLYDRYIQNEDEARRIDQDIAALSEYDQQVFWAKYHDIPFDDTSAQLNDLRTAISSLNDSINEKSTNQEQLEEILSEIQILRKQVNSFTHAN